MSSLRFRRAEASDLPRSLLCSRTIRLAPNAKNRLIRSHAATTAFAAIAGDPNNELVVATLDGTVVAMLQLTFIRYLTHQRSWRALIEGVRVHSGHRSQGMARNSLAGPSPEQPSEVVASSNSRPTRSDLTRSASTNRWASWHLMKGSNSSCRRKLPRVAQPNPSLSQTRTGLRVRLSFALHFLAGS